MTTFEKHLPKFILVFVFIVAFSFILFVKGCVDEINERGMKSIVLELWDRPDK